MGIRPEGHIDEIFRDTSLKTDEGHPVPVSNFLNAQCTFVLLLSVLCSLLTKCRLFRDSDWNTTSDVQGCT